MENKFKVGDYVKANEQGNAKYNITDYRMRRGKVINIDGKYMDIEVIDHEEKNKIGQQHNVFCEHFELMNVTLSNLRFADVITLRNNERYVVASDYLYGEYAENDCDCDGLLDCYNDDLTYDASDASEWDIVKVERNGQVIYERKETTREMTVSEIEKELGITGLRIKKED